MTREGAFLLAQDAPRIPKPRVSKPLEKMYLIYDYSAEHDAINREKSRTAFTAIHRKAYNVAKHEADNAYCYYNAFCSYFRLHEIHKCSFIFRSPRQEEPGSPLYETS